MMKIVNRIQLGVRWQSWKTCVLNLSTYLKHFSVYDYYSVKVILRFILSIISKLSFEKFEIFTIIRNLFNEG